MQKSSSNIKYILASVVAAVALVAFFGTELFTQSQLGNLERYDAVSTSAPQQAKGQETTTMSQKDFAEAKYQYSDYIAGYNRYRASVDDCLAEGASCDAKRDFWVHVLASWKEGKEKNEKSLYDLLGEVDYFLGQNIKYNPAKLAGALTQSKAKEPAQVIREASGICVDTTGLGYFMLDYVGFPRGQMGILFLAYTDQPGGHTVLMATVDDETYLFGEGYGVIKARKYFAENGNYVPAATMTQKDDGAWVISRLSEDAAKRIVNKQ